MYEKKFVSESMPYLSFIVMVIHYNLHYPTPVYFHFLSNPAKNPILLNFSVYFFNLSIPTTCLIQPFSSVREVVGLDRFAYISCM